MRKYITAVLGILFLSGCALTAPKKQDMQAQQSKTWSEMFDKGDWSPVNSAKLTEDKVVK